MLIDSCATPQWSIAKKTLAQSKNKKAVSESSLTAIALNQKFFSNCLFNEQGYM
nr:hypothetical protein [Chromobacterium amazonense]